MKKIRKSLILCLGALAITGLVGCEKKNNDPTPSQKTESSVTLSESAITFYTCNVGAKAKHGLTATVTPATKEVAWSSDNTSVATVSSSGEVTMVGEGRCNITAQVVGEESKASCVVNVFDAVPTLPIRHNSSYATYLRNIQPNPTNKFAEFFDRSQTYEVGDDNKFSFKPLFTVVDENDQDLPQGEWEFPFEYDIKVENGGVFENANVADYSIVNELEAEIKFNESAVGKKFRVSVTLGGLTAQEKVEHAAEITVSYDVKVVDGVNISSEYELAYLERQDVPEEYGWNDDEFTPDWASFKVQHGVNPLLRPAAVVLHKDMHLKKEHIPSSFVVSEADAAGWDAAEKAASLGSLKDRAFLYQKSDAASSTLSGNYFTLDWSEIPLVTRTNGKPSSASAKVESHSVFMRVNGSGSFEIKNVNFIGNAHAAQTEDDQILAGGLCGFKTGDSANLTITNTLGHGCYMTVHASPSNREAEPGLLTITDSKLYDNYNCFIYNWGGKLYAERCLFEGCGGPVVIQDHVYSENDKYDNFEQDTSTGVYQFSIIGRAPESTFLDCEFNNYVIGTEAWFQSFGVSGLVEQIKQMGDLLFKGGMAKSMIFYVDGEGNYKPGVYSMLAPSSIDTLFNFILLNKSGDAESITSVPVHGTAKFLKSTETDPEVRDNFNYMAPPVVDDEHPYDPSYMMLGALYNGFRQANGLGAPVFQTSGDVGVYIPPYYTNDSLASLESLVLNFMTGSAVTGVSNNLTQAAHEEVALYYNGMMLVMGLGSMM